MINLEKENKIRDYIRYELKYYTQLNPVRGYIPLDSQEWHSLYESLDKSRDIIYELYYIETLQIARDNFQDIIWDIEFNLEDSGAYGPFKVWLVYQF